MLKKYHQASKLLGAMEALKFLSTFFRDLKNVASIVQTVPSAAKKIVDQLDFSKPVVVVEYGPGLGPVSGEVARRMSPTSRLILIEQNETFLLQLKEKFSHDERVVIVRGLAQNVAHIVKEHEVEGVDAVISSIPFSFFTPELANTIVRATAHVLKPEGIFLIFQFTHTIAKYLPLSFSRVKHFMIWWNIPPLTVYVARK